MTNCNYVDEYGCGGSYNCHWCGVDPCTDERANYDVTTCYFCTNESPDSGQYNSRTQCGSNQSTCGLGCAFSDDEPSDFYYRADNVQGTRFLLRYDPALNDDILLQARDAYGRLHDLRSRQPWKVPSDCHWIRAPIWENHTGRECFGDACEFSDPKWPRDFLIDGTCENGETEGEAMEASYSDCFFFGGWHELDSLNANYFHCRDHCEKTVGVVTPMTRRGVLTNPMLFRSDGPVETNALLGATIEVIRDPAACFNSFAYRHDEGEVCNWKPDGTYYNDTTSRSRFNYLRVTIPTAFIQENDDGYGYDQSYTALKNAVLQYIQTRQLPGYTLPGGSIVQAIRFDQIDRLNFDFYRRDWNFFNDCPPAVYPTISAGVKLKKAHLHCEIILHRVNDELGPCFYPYITLWWHAELETDLSLKEVNWYGTLNSFSNPSSPRIALVDGAGGYWDELADKMINIFVPGKNMFDETIPSPQFDGINYNGPLYAGGVKLSFPE